MTAQISDIFIYDRKQFELIGIKGDDIFSPENYGMTPEATTSACWRGWYATFKLNKPGLFLHELTINEKNQNYMPLNGVEPENGRYSNLKMKLPFTGKIRLARDFLDEYYVHQGFQKPSAFKTVIDFSIENGKIIDINDRSDEVEKIRGQFHDKYNGSTNIVQRIDDAYSMDMELE